jgi:hypothetical protein
VRYLLLVEWYVFVSLISPHRASHGRTRYGGLVRYLLLVRWYVLYINIFCGGLSFHPSRYRGEVSQMDLTLSGS